MISETNALVYRCVPSIVWVREQNCLRLIDRQTGSMWNYDGVEAMLWDLMALGYAYSKIIAFSSELLDISKHQAEEVIMPMLSKWHAAGILEIAKDD